MPVFQFKCENCSAIFEYLVSSVKDRAVDCITCGSNDISRVESAYFYPNKIFCPHDKELNTERLKKELSGILRDRHEKCGGCGTDGAPGRCESQSGIGGCGKNCSCKNKSQKLNFDLYGKNCF